MDSPYNQKVMHHLPSDRQQPDTPAPSRKGRAFFVLEQHLQLLIILNIIVIMKKVRVLPIIVRRYFNDEV